MVTVRSHEHAHFPFSRHFRAVFGSKNTTVLVKLTVNDIRHSSLPTPSCHAMREVCLAPVYSSKGGDKTGTVPIERYSLMD